MGKCTHRDHADRTFDRDLFGVFGLGATTAGCAYLWVRTDSLALHWTVVRRT